MTGTAKRTFCQQTGWKRPTPQAICQSYDVLRTVTEYSYDLHDPAFQDYAKKRGVLYKAGCQDRFEFTANHNITRSDYAARFYLSEEDPQGIQHPLSDDAIEVHWQIMLAAKGSMQDCWDLYQATLREG